MINFFYVFLLRIHIYINSNKYNIVVLIVSRYNNNYPSCFLNFKKLKPQREKINIIICTCILPLLIIPIY